MLQNSLIDRLNPLPAAVPLHQCRIVQNPLRLGVTSLDTLVSAAWKSLRSETGHRTILFRKHDLGDAYCDAGLLQQVFVNLLANSIRHTLGRNPAVLQVGSFLREGEQVVFVRDNGTGFDERYGDQGDTGRSIATVTGIVHNHGGRIWSNPGAGREATFYFTLGAPATVQRSLPHGVANRKRLNSR